jgi:hypothetical protein
MGLEDMVSKRKDSIRNRRMFEDNRRQIARPSSASASSRQKAAEAEAAKERDRQAYRERGWPSG